jgi:hypothetical protein
MKTIVGENDVKLNTSLKCEPTIFNRATSVDSRKKRAPCLMSMSFQNGAIMTGPPGPRGNGIGAKTSKMLLKVS